MKKPTPENMSAAAAPTPVTGATPFGPIGPGNDNGKLFSVNPGVPIGDALEKASCILAAALDVLWDMGTDAVRGSEEPWAVFFLVEMSKAVVDSVWDAGNCLHGAYESADSAQGATA